MRMELFHEDKGLCLGSSERFWNALLRTHQSIDEQLRWNQYRAQDKDCNNLTLLLSKVGSILGECLANISRPEVFLHASEDLADKAEMLQDEVSNALHLLETWFDHRSIFDDSFRETRVKETMEKLLILSSYVLRQRCLS